MHPFLTTVMLCALLSVGMAQNNEPTAPPTEAPTTPSNFRYTLGGEIAAPFGLSLSSASTALSGGTAFTFKLSGSVGAEENPTAAFSANLIARADIATGTTRLELGETYITAYLGDFDLSAGNLRVNWGATDLFSVLNTINPQDLTRMESIPVPALRAVWNLPDDARLEAVLVPGFTPSVLPTTTGEIPASLPPGVSIVGQNAPIENRPNASLANAQYGLRYTAGLDVFDGGDFSLSYYGGLRHTPTATVQLIPAANPGQFTVQPRFNYDWIYVLGADTNLAVGGFAVRAEAAYTFTQDMSATNPAIGNPSLEATAQLETTFEQTSYTGLLNTRWQKGEAGQPDSFRLSAALIVLRELDGRTSLSGAWVQSLTDGSGVVAPRLEYILADGLKAEAGLRVGYGAGGSSLNPTGQTTGGLSFGLKLSF